MEQEKFKKELEKKLSDIKEKIGEVKSILDKEKTPSKLLKDIFNQLKEVQEDLLAQYDQLEAMKNQQSEGYSKLEKNIFKNLESFDTTFSKAGSIMKESKFQARNHSVDFKNPPGTE
jgi:hypothetical protein